MGNQLQKNSGLSSLIDSNASKQIVVVHQGPSSSQGSSQLQEHLKQLPPIVKPLIPNGQSSLNGQYPALQPNILYDFGLKFEQELRNNAEIVSKEQNKLADKIRDIDHCVGIVISSIAIDRQRKINKACDDFVKFDEIDQVILRCEADIDNILVSFAKLTEALPKSFEIEPFALRS